MSNSVIERFKQISDNGKFGSQTLDPQMKYDVLAAIHSMEELESVINALDAHAKKRESLRKKLVMNAQAALGNLIDMEDWKISDVDAALKVLNSCRNEIARIEGEETTEKTFRKLVQDGISAGR